MGETPSQKCPKCASLRLVVIREGAGGYIKGMICQNCHYAWTPAGEIWEPSTAHQSRFSIQQHRMGGRTYWRIMKDGNIFSSNTRYCRIQITRARIVARAMADATGEISTIIREDRLHG